MPVAVTVEECALLRDGLFHALEYGQLLAQVVGAEFRGTVGTAFIVVHGETARCAALERVHQTARPLAIVSLRTTGRARRLAAADPAKGYSLAWAAAQADRCRPANDNRRRNSLRAIAEQVYQVRGGNPLLACGSRRCWELAISCRPTNHRRHRSRDARQNDHEIRGERGQSLRQRGPQTSAWLRRQRASLSERARRARGLPCFRRIAYAIDARSYWSSCAQEARIAFSRAQSSALICNWTEKPPKCGVNDDYADGLCQYMSQRR